MLLSHSNLLHDFLRSNIMVNDLPYVNSFILIILKKLIFKIQTHLTFHLYLIIKMKLNLVKNFLNQVVKEYDILKDHLIGRTPNWESDRIARIDYIILITSTAELLYFPSIPTKVTLNEYIEIAKEFSSPSSGKFVNGVIDNIVKDLTNKGQIVKKGRGLIS